VLRFVRALKAEALPHEKLRYVLNRAPKFTDLSAKSRVKRMAESLDIDIEVQLPDGGAQVTQANDHGLPLAESAAKNPCARRLQKLAKSLHDLNKGRRSRQGLNARGPRHVFSRFKKDGNAPASGRPAAPAAAAPAAAARPPVDNATARSRPAPAAGRPAAEAVSADKEKKRKERLTELKLEMHKRLLENLNLPPWNTRPRQSLKQRSPPRLETLDELSVALNKDDRSTLVQELYDEVMGLGPLEPLLKDETINDILVNGPQAHLCRTRGQAGTDRRHLPRRTPPDAHHRQDRLGRGAPRRRIEPLLRRPPCRRVRFNCMVPPVAVDGSLVSIRKFKKEKLKIEDLVRFGAFTEEMAAYLQAAVSTRLNIIVSGGTGSGKTTTLNALSSPSSTTRTGADHRGHRRTAAAAGPCRPDGKPARERRGQGRGDPARLLCATRCGCVLTGSSSAKPAARKSSTCCRP
jgi:hypothetical protein